MWLSWSAPHVTINLVGPLRHALRRGGAWPMAGSSDLDDMVALGTVGICLAPRRGAAMKRPGEGLDFGFCLHGCTSARRF